MQAKPSSDPSTHIPTTPIHSKTSHPSNVIFSKTPASDLQLNTNPIHNKALWSDKIMDIDDTQQEPSQSLTHQEGDS